MNPIRIILMCAMCLLTLGLWAADEPRVVVTIKPLHSIISALLDQVAIPELLLDGSSSPHTYSLKPSDARILEQADLVIWVGPALEGFLKKAIEIRRSTTPVITFTDLAFTSEPGHAKNPAQAHSHGDPHLWLDPETVISIIPQLVRSMADALPQHRQAIEHNAQQLIRRLRKLNQQIYQDIGDDKQLSAIAYHDAWRYFEKRYSLHTRGIVSVHEQQQPSASHLHRLQQQIRIEEIQCLLVEPQYNPKYLDALITDHAIRLVVADPLGANTIPGPDAYFEIMRDISGAFSQCLRN